MDRVALDVVFVQCTEPAVVYTPIGTLAAPDTATDRSGSMSPQCQAKIE